MDRSAAAGVRLFGRVARLRLEPDVGEAADGFARRTSVGDLRAIRRWSATTPTPRPTIRMPDRDAIRPSRITGDVELVPVVCLMAAGTEGDQVVGVGRSPIDPVFEMVGVEVHGATADHTALIPVDDESTEMIGHRPTGSTEGEWRAGVLDDRLHRRVTRDQPPKLVVEDRPEFGAGDQLAVLEIEMDDHLRPITPRA